MEAEVGEQGARTVVERSVGRILVLVLLDLPAELKGHRPGHGEIDRALLVAGATPPTDASDHPGYSSKRPAFLAQGFRELVQQPANLDTFAAAYAEAGDFGAAVK